MFPWFPAAQFMLFFGLPALYPIIFSNTSTSLFFHTKNSLHLGVWFLLLHNITVPVYMSWVQLLSFHPILKRENGEVKPQSQ